MPVEANISACAESASNSEDEFISITVKGVEWQDRIAESPDLYWRFHGFVDFESPFQEFPIASVNIEKWRVLRHTPKGVWIAPPFSNKWNEERLKRLIVHHTRKKHAYPTKKEAWESYCIRQKRRRAYWTTEGRRIEALDAVVAAENYSFGEAK